MIPAGEFLPTAAERLARDVQDAVSLIGRIGQTAAGWDEARLLAVMTAANGSERYLPYSILQLLNQATMAGLHVDVVLGLNCGYSCPAVVAYFESLPTIDVLHFETGPKEAPQRPAALWPRGASFASGALLAASAAAADRHRLLVVHQRPGDLSAGKMFMLLDAFGGLLLPSLERGWRAPRWAMLVDAETLFLEREPDPGFQDALARARAVLDGRPRDLQEAVQRICADAKAARDEPVSDDVDLASHGLVRMIEELRADGLDLLGPATRFTTYQYSTTVAGLPVDMPTPYAPTSAMHLFYSEASGLLAGCHCISGAGALAKTEVLLALMGLILHRHPEIYADDGMITVLAEQAGLRLRLSRRMQITNRCPAPDECAPGTTRLLWQLQFAKWYRAFDQVEALYGRDACESVLGPGQEDFMAAGLALAVRVFRRTGDRPAALALARRFAGCRTALGEIRALVQEMEQAGA